MLTRAWENYSQQPVENQQNASFKARIEGIRTLFTPFSVGPVGKYFHIILQRPVRPVLFFCPPVRVCCIRLPFRDVEMFRLQAQNAIGQQSWPSAWRCSVFPAVACARLCRGCGVGNFFGSRLPEQNCLVAYARSGADRLSGHYTGG